MHRAGRARAAGRPLDVRLSVRLHGRLATRIPPGSRLGAPHRSIDRGNVGVSEQIGSGRRGDASSRAGAYFPGVTIFRAEIRTGSR